MPKTAVDVWMEQDFVFPAGTLRKQSAMLLLLRLPALVGLFFIAHPIFVGDSEVLDQIEADVLGMAGEICLFLTLAVTPVITVTRMRWIAPLRRWYGIMFAITAITDAVTASITTGFAGGVFGRLAGHSFLLVGFLSVLLTLPLLATANTPAQRWLGKYWKQLQRMTYVIWGLLLLHLALLESLGIDGAEGDGDAFFHQKLYQAIACSIPLLVLRLPLVTRWIAKEQKAGNQARVYWTISPLVALFVLGMIFMWNEEIFKGMMALSLHVVGD
jgi:DMSO/TMAO reductase YedYZ heme-binding membrane subunit